MARGQTAWRSAAARVRVRDRVRVRAHHAREQRARLAEELFDL